MSIDAPSAQMSCSAANDSFNYIDTFTEFLIEDVLHFENAIPESKDRQQKELQLHKQLEVAFQKIEVIDLPRSFSVVKIKHLDYLDKYAFQFIKEINPPPPKSGFQI
ncbi:MAG: hypothetical protein NVSMB45_07650 [Ginsengibacter sp.]